MKWRSLETNDTDLRPLREIYAERKGLIEKYVPQEIPSDIDAIWKSLLSASQIRETGEEDGTFGLSECDTPIAIGLNGLRWSRAVSSIGKDDVEFPNCLARSVVSVERVVS